MFGRLFTNTLISAVAFVATSLLGLIAIPIIIGTWGLTQFGLIVLARSFLPIGALAVIDLGASEITTNAVARARVNSDWTAASAVVTIVLLVSTVFGFIVAALLVAAVPWLISLFRIAPEDAEAFRLVLYVTAAANVLFFPSLIADGIVKGFERFPILRAFDIASAAIYVAGAAVAAYLGTSFAVVAIMFLVGNGVRYLALWVVGLTLARREGLRFFVRADAATKHDTHYRCWLMTQSKFIGIIQGPLLPVIVGILFGPRAAGLYDVLVRLPRFAKTVLSIFNSSLLPVAARIDERREDDQISRLGRAGLILLPAITVPPLIGAAVFSEPILRMWIGGEIAVYWVWMAMMFAMPIGNQYISFGGTIMLARPEILRILNRIAIAQAVVTIAAIIAGLQLFEERAFILGQAIGWLAFFPGQLWVVGPELRISRRTIAWNLAVLILIVAPLAAGVLYAGLPARLENPLLLGIILSSWCAIIWAALYAVLLDNSAREEIRLMARRLVGSRRRAAPQS